MEEVLRIGNCSGFYGDRLSAAREMVEGGPIDVLTGDWLAELTMAILVRDRAKDPAGGYAKTFLRQLRDVLVPCAERGIKVISNAGGLNPAGCAAAAAELARELGVDVRVAHVEGDDLFGRLDELRAAGIRLEHLDTGEALEAAVLPPISANAYLGGWGIAEELRRGADVVITGRTTDAAPVVGAAAWRFGWARDDWDALAGAVAAGHVLECGAQATGGNFAFWAEVPGMERVGFPLAEVAADGSAVITKHPGMGGAVTVDTVTAQLLYEIGPPAYASPDVTARFDTLTLEAEGPDRVRLSGTRGEPPPSTTKVALNCLGGHRNGMTVLITGLDVEAKAALVERTVWAALPGGREAFADTAVRLLRADREDPASSEEAVALLDIQVADPDERKVGRAFSSVVVELALATIPGFTLTAPPGRGSPFAVYWPALVPAELVVAEVVLGEERVSVPAAFDGRAAAHVDAPPAPAPAADGGEAERVRTPLGRVFGTRSGDKGGNANLGVWARDDAAHAWLHEELTAERLQELLPETRGLRVERHELPNLRAVNFVVHGLLGRGVSSSLRLDPQAKGLGEYLGAKVVELPAALLPGGAP